MPAECETDNCGVLAVGRCATCGHAYCRSHSNGNTLRLDLCGRCAKANQRRHSERFEASQQARREPFDRLRQLADALEKAGHRPPRHYRATKRQTTWLGFSREVDNPSQDGYGWDVGTFQWQYVDENARSFEDATPTVVASNGVVYMKGGEHINRSIDPMSTAQMWRLVARFEEVLATHSVPIPVRTAVEGDK